MLFFLYLNCKAESMRCVSACPCKKCFAMTVIVMWSNRGAFLAGVAKGCCLLSLSAQRADSQSQQRVVQVVFSVQWLTMQGQETCEVCVCVCVCVLGKCLMVASGHRQPRLRHPTCLQFLSIYYVWLVTACL